MVVGRWRLGVLLAAMATCFAALTGTAGAHGPEATFTPVSQEQVAGELAVNLRVTLIYDDDADPVDDATVEVTPVDASGAAGAQLILPRAPEPGTYEGVVPVTEPGDWTFQLVSEDPEAALDVVIAIPEPAPVTTAAPALTTAEVPATSDAPTPSSLPEGTEADGPSTTVASVDATSGEDSTGDDDGGFPWGIAVLVAVVAAGVAMAMAYGMRPGSEDPEGEGGDVGESGPGSLGRPPDVPTGDG